MFRLNATNFLVKPCTGRYNSDPAFHLLESEVLTLESHPRLIVLPSNDYSFGFLHLLPLTCCKQRRFKRPVQAPMSTDSLVLLFTKLKNTWLAAVNIQPLPCRITCHDVCVLPQASLQKSLDSQKMTRSAKFTRFKIFASKFTVLLEII